MPQRTDRQRAAVLFPSHTVGLIEPGNIDLKKQPRVKNPDGSISTVRSMSINEDGVEILIPTVAHTGKRILSDEAAIAQWRASKKHLGKFRSAEDATTYAKQLHDDYQRGVYD